MPKKPKRAAINNRLRMAVVNMGLQPNFPAALPSDKKPSEAWHIAVRGNIDFRQHHPSWYKAIGAITEVEMKQGITSLMTGAGFQFDVGAFAINVIPDRWMIQTISERNCSRLISVASKVFEALYELPLAAYGIHKTMVLEIPNEKAKRFLANQLVGSKLALQDGDAEAYITYFKKLPDGTVTQIWFNPSSVADKWLNVEHNRHHELEGSAMPEHFDLGEMLVKNAETDWKIATAYGDDLAKAIAKGE